MDNLESLLMEVQNLNKEKKYDVVSDLLTNELLRQSNDASLYAEKAQATYRLGHLDRAEEYAELSLGIDSANIVAHQYRGYVFYDKKDYKSAITHFEAILKIEKDNYKALCMLGNSYTEFKKYELALKYYLHAIDVDSTQSYAYLSLADSYFKQKRFDLSIANFEKALDIDPNDVFSLYTIGFVYENMREYEKAGLYYGKVLNIDPADQYALNGMGGCFFRKEEYENAKSFFNRAIVSDPTYLFPYYNLGTLSFNLNDYAAAEKTFMLVLSIDKNDPVANKGLGDVYFQQELFEKSLEHYKGTMSHLKMENVHEKANVTERIGEIEKILGIPGYNKIRKLINEVKATLKYSSGSLSHYTSLEVTKAIVLKSSPFRLSEGSFLNDTSEGKELFNFLELQLPDYAGLGLIATPFIPKPFIGSFVTASKKDDLNLWRMYGKQEKDEAKGCSLTFDLKLFLKDLQSKYGYFRPEKLKNSDKYVIRVLSKIEQFNFYRVAYRKSTTKNFTIPDGEELEENFNILMQNLAERVNEFDKTNNENLKALFELLNEIAYLIKTSEYQFEYEIRLVLKGFTFDKITDAPPRVYIELVNVLPSLEVITFGPKVEKPEEWAASFHYSMINNKFTSDILISHLPYK